MREGCAAKKILDFNKFNTKKSINFTIFGFHL